MHCGHFRTRGTVWLVGVSVSASASIGYAATPAGPGFTYQGQLRRSGQPVGVNCDFVFTLWDDAGTGSPPAGGVQIGNAVSRNNVTVRGGRFTVQLNANGEFGPAAFDGYARWLGIAVRCPAGQGSFVPLGPRQAITPAPYALRVVPDTQPRYLAISPFDFHINNLRHAKKLRCVAPIGCVLRLADTCTELCTAATEPLVAAPVHLPDGVAVTELLVAYLDIDVDHDLVVQLQRENIITGATDTLATVTSSGAPEFSSASVTAIAHEQIDNRQFTYYLGASWPTEAFAFIGLRSMRIRYEAASAGP